MVLVLSIVLSAYDVRKFLNLIMVKVVTVVIANKVRYVTLSMEAKYFE